MSNPNLGYIVEALQHLAVPLDELTPDPKNARIHSARNLNAIEASLLKFKFREPIVVQKQGMIIRAGNGRYEVARRLGWTHVPAVVVDEADADAVAFAIADNRTAELGEWDFSSLTEQLVAITPLGLLDAAGFLPSEMETLRPKRLPMSTGPDADGDDRSSSASEIDVDSFSLAHKCPRCGMEFDD